MLDVYAFVIPNSVEVPIIPKELGLDYTLHPVMSARARTRRMSFLILDPNGKVPDPECRDGFPGTLVPVDLVDEVGFNTGKRFTWMVAPRSAKLAFTGVMPGYRTGSGQITG